MNYFAKRRRFLPEQLFAALDRSKNGRDQGKQSAIWVLDQKDDATMPIGWAEIQIFPGAFTTVWLISEGFKAEVLVALPFLVSTIFIAAKADVVRIVDAKPGRSLLDGECRNWGEASIVHTMRPEFSWLGQLADPLTPWPTINISAQAWWNSELGAKTQGELAYLTKRIAREEQAKTLKRKRPQRPRGLLERIFKPQ